MLAFHRLALPRRTARTLLLATAVPFFALAAHAQSSSNPSSMSSPTVSADSSGFDEATPPSAMKTHMLRKMALERNELRQKTIVDDTTQLLQLAEQLKAAVDKSDKDQLSLNVINTVSEIEKLAKTVKDRMRDGN